MFRAALRSRAGRGRSCCPRSLALVTRALAPETGPLSAKTVVVTRARAQASELSDQLTELGASVLEVPTIRIGDPSDGGAALRDAASRLDSFDWVVVTSPNGAHRLLTAAPDARSFGTAKVAAIGPGTASVLAEGDVVADLVAKRYVAEGLMEVFGVGPGRVLIVRAAVARDVIPDGLAEKGWEVEIADAYRTLPEEIDDETKAAVGAADVVTFTSSSTVTNFLAAVGVEATPSVVAVIGPITAQTAREAGLDVTVEAEDHTISGLVAALAAHAIQ